MKRIVNSIAQVAAARTFRTMTAAALCMTFVIYPALRTSSAKVIYTATDLKTESQVRTEATTYDAAIKAIASITSLKLDNADQLKKALAIVNREGPNLRFSRSKLIVLGLSNSTFVNTIKKRSSDKAAAEALLKEVSADPKAVLKLDGAQAFGSRLQSSAAADSSILKRSSEALKAAAAKLKQARQGADTPNIASSDAMKLLPVGYTTVPQPNEWAPLPQGGAVLGLIVAVVVVVVIVNYGFTFVKNISTKEGQDAVADCLVAVTERLGRCGREAESQPFPFNVAAEALCAADYLAASANCLVNP